MSAATLWTSVLTAWQVHVGACVSCDFTCDTHMTHELAYCNLTPSDIVIDGQDSEGRRALEIWEQKSYVGVKLITVALAISTCSYRSTDKGIFSYQR